MTSGEGDRGDLFEAILRVSSVYLSGFICLEEDFRTIIEYDYQALNEIACER